MKRYLYPFELIGIFVSLAVSYLGSLVTRPTIQDGTYATWIKSPLTPPDYVFPIVWTILFVLMGYGYGRVVRTLGSFKKARLETALFIIQLGFNFLWSYLFFGLRRPDFALYEIVPFWLLLVYTYYQYRKINHLSGVCYVPYVLWVALAIYLNFYIAFYN